ncbi:MAG: ABC-2 family transporter protein [DPANN group archaeon]|nr:ABC-2 family transporter protein [DPANN group archaeon]
MKYFGAVKLGVKELLAYRFEVTFWGIIALFHLAIWYFIWRAVFSHTGTEIIGGFSFKQMMGYYVISMIVDYMTFSGIDNDITEGVRTGTLFKDVIRPFNLYYMYFSEHFGYKLLAAGLQGIPLALVAIFLAGVTTTPVYLLLFFISLAFALVLKFSFSYLFGLLAFWLTKTSGLFRIKNGIQNFLQGVIIPLSLFPAGVQAALAFLPFPYMVFVPTQIFLQKYTLTESLVKIGIQIIWVLALLAIISYVWQRARKRFEVVGT